MPTHTQTRLEAASDLQQACPSAPFWREWVLGCLFCALLGVLIYSPITFGGRTFASSPVFASVFAGGSWRGVADFDALNASELPLPQTFADPTASVLNDELTPYVNHRAFANASIPWVNPYQGMGHPWAANLMSMVLFPLHWLASAFPSPLVWDLFLLARFVLFGAFMFLYLRRLALSRTAALAGALLCIGGGYTTATGNLVHLNVDMLAPLLLLFTESWIQSARSRHLGALALVVGLAFLGGNPQPLLLFFLMLVVYVPLRLWLPAQGLAPGAAVEFPRKIKALLLPGLALGLEVGLAGFLLFPFLEFYRDSFHMHTSQMIELRVAPANRIFAFFPALFNPTLASLATLQGAQNGPNALFGPGVVAFMLLLLSPMHWRRFLPVLASCALLCVLYLLKVCAVLPHGMLESLPILSKLGLSKYQSMPLVCQATLAFARWTSRLRPGS